MNSVLAKDIEREFFEGEESQRIQNAIMLEREGIIEIFVRDGRHQKTILPLRSVFKDEGSPRQLVPDSYEEMVKVISKAIIQYEKEIDYGYLILSYRANEDGRIDNLDFNYKMEVPHSKKK